jgi:hypothetical protein
MSEPLYRPVLREAFRVAWRGARLWPLALVAGILLSGSVADVVWRMSNALAPQASLSSAVTLFWARALQGWSGFQLTDILIGGVRVFQISALFLIIGFAIAGLSVICQGALVFAIGTGRATKRLRVRDAITVGARAFWPVFVLNLFGSVILIATRSLLGMIIALAHSTGSAGVYLLYLASFTVFVLLAILVTIIQIFALNAMILQGATIVQAIERAAKMVQAHWVAVTETALILFVLSLGAWVAALLANALLAIPVFTLLMTASLLGSQTLTFASLLLLLIGILLVLLTVLGAFITLQYATWTLLFRRMGEGGVVPKIHRWFRHLTHGYHVPGA